MKEREAAEIGINAKHEKLDQRATVCLSSREYQLLTELAMKLDLTMSKLVRRSVLLSLGVRQPDER